MTVIRQRIARLFENLIAFGVGAIVVCLANGMSPREMIDLAMANAHKIPEALPEMVASIFSAGFLG